MRFVLAYYHRDEHWATAAGLVPPPLGYGGLANSWSVQPGKYLRSIRRGIDGQVDLWSVLWSPARPVLWDIDARSVVVSRSAICVSGFYIELDDRWRYFAAPGDEPIFLAAAGGQKAAALLGWAPGGDAGGMPAIVLAEDAVRWASEEGTAADAFRRLQRWPADAFRSWSVQSPIDRPPLRERDDDSLIVPLLDPPHEKTRRMYRRRRILPADPGRSTT
ncbi:hypothetical protein L3067_03995 [Xanthomonas sp. PPL568]|uniref:hypothetical protein n=1 Tax=Xanthomonas indica TaxID=2912242 RepID=UPI001F588CDA|nr:hypothetical protein [Xanthomonas indica]MCI2243768.1 hypothetical protein [Xanthomonas indica]